MEKIQNPTTKKNRFWTLLADIHQAQISVFSLGSFLIAS
jgi:hypothetical protein